MVLAMFLPLMTKFHRYAYAGQASERVAGSFAFKAYSIFSVAGSLKFLMLTGASGNLAGISSVPQELRCSAAGQAAAFPQNRTQVDVRPAGAFSREGAGHIPGVKSFPADRLIDPETPISTSTDP